MKTEYDAHSINTIVNENIKNLNELQKAKFNLFCCSELLKDYIDKPEYSYEKSIYGNYLILVKMYIGDHIFDLQIFHNHLVALEKFFANMSSYSNNKITYCFSVLQNVLDNIYKKMKVQTEKINCFYPFFSLLDLSNVNAQEFNKKLFICLGKINELLNKEELDKLCDVVEEDYNEADAEDKLIKFDDYYIVEDSKIYFKGRLPKIETKYGLFKYSANEDSNSMECGSEVQLFDSLKELNDFLMKMNLDWDYYDIVIRKLNVKVS